LGISLNWEIKIFGERWIKTKKLCFCMEAFLQKEK
jgi:hypothetical protein